ncbi:MAG: Mrp/NBP35 family ATP-binding protein [Bacteroidales bacterium]|nr:Mrp/NBP35 family ATP-binding protein [Bacteroidales bacterium]
MSMTEQGVIAVLQTVIHPETKSDIVSMGMVRSLTVAERKVSFVLQLTKRADPFALSLRKTAAKRLADELGPNVEVDIAVVADVTPAASPAPEQGPKRLLGVKHIVMVASGKGGVGKSTVASNLAVALAQAGAKVGLIDADIFGPSLPKMMGVEHDKPQSVSVDGHELMLPLESYGVKMQSIGLFADPQSALIWRGPMASNALKQLLFQTQWGELDFLLIDMPPGTSDIHLTITQELKLTGAIVVSTPQDVALADAIKGISMLSGANLRVPLLGLVENMAWFTPEELPQSRYYIFGKDGCKHLAEHLGVPLLGQIPIVQGIREGGDYGQPIASQPESIMGRAFAELAQRVAQRVAEVAPSNA